MGTEAVLEKKKKREKRDQDLKGERKRDRHRGENEKNTGDRRERRRGGSSDRRMSKDSNTTIEASHHITVEVVFLLYLFTFQMFRSPHPDKILSTPSRIWRPLTTRKGGQREEGKLETEEVGEARSTSTSRTDHLEPGRGSNWTSKRQRTNLPNFK